MGIIKYEGKYIEMNKFPLDWEMCRDKVADINLTENSLILDVGSKDGKKAKYAIDKGQLIMTDISRKSLSPFVLSDATFLPFSDNSTIWLLFFT